ncbi:hypothetical protein BDZ90DRAFT_260362, partial [Jaminaea rosea]
MYVGAVWDQWMCDRQAEHIERFTALRKAEAKGTLSKKALRKLQYKQANSYRRKTKKTLHFVLTRTPEDFPTPHIGEWLELVGHGLTGQYLDLL